MRSSCHPLAAAAAACCRHLLPARWLPARPSPACQQPAVPHPAVTLRRGGQRAAGMAAVLITGGTGYLGQFLTRHFAASGLKASGAGSGGGRAAGRLLVHGQQHMLCAVRRGRKGRGEGRGGAPTCRPLRLPCSAAPLPTPLGCCRLGSRTGTVRCCTCAGTGTACCCTCDASSCHLCHFTPAQVGFTYWHCTEPDKLCCAAVQGFKVRAAGLLRNCRCVLLPLLLVLLLLL